MCLDVKIMFDLFCRKGHFGSISSLYILSCNSAVGAQLVVEVYTPKDILDSYSMTVFLASLELLYSLTVLGIDLHTEQTERDIRWLTPRTTSLSLAPMSSSTARHY